MQSDEPSNAETPVVEVDTELADLIPLYLSHRWADLVTARQLLGDGDLAGLSRMAHKIRGTAASYGFYRLGEIADTLETAAESGDVAGIERHLAAYDAYLRGVRIEYV